MPHTWREPAQANYRTESSAEWRGWQAGLCVALRPGRPILRAEQEVLWLY